MAGSRRGRAIGRSTAVALVASVALVALVGVVAGPWSALWLVAVAVAAAFASAAHRRALAARDAAVGALVALLAEKDPYTGEHTERVARYTVWIGEELGLSRRRLADLHRAALLHDVGKLLVPTDLLAKPDRLTEHEFRCVQQHAHVCDDVLGGIDVLRRFAGAAAGHHRRYDGQGYGGRRRAEFAAAVVAVADAYDAMTSTRAYRRALAQETAFAELRAGAGSQFHPAYVAALVRAVQGRGVRHGLGFERSAVVYAVEPPVRGPGSPGARPSPTPVPA